MGPIIDAIDAGHVEGKKECKLTGDPWPCPEMIDARRQQVVYAEQLRINKMAENVKATGIFR